MRPSFTEAIERRRRNWRIGLITIIVITIPFYCVGIFLWGTAPQQHTPTPAIVKFATLYATARSLSTRARVAYFASCVYV